MRHGTSNRRQRNRGNNGRRGNQPQRTQVYDSNGPDVRIRGTAHQVCEKYLALAKDAVSAGDWTMAENYYQHAEHYQRIINEIAEYAEERSYDNQQNRESVSGNTYTNNAHAYNPNRQPQPVENDLGLPKSILGEKPKIVSEAKLNQEVTSLAD